MSFDDDIEAKQLHHIGKAPGRDDVPTELLAMWVPVADAQASSFCVARIAGDAGHTSRIQRWAELNLHSIPKTPRALEDLSNWRPLPHGGTLF